MTSQIMQDELFMFPYHKMEEHVIERSCERDCTKEVFISFHIEIISQRLDTSGIWEPENEADGSLRRGLGIFAWTLPSVTFYTNEPL